MKYLLLILLLPSLVFAAPAIPTAEAVYCGGDTPAAVKFAAINVAAGDTTVVTAVTGKKIRVLSYMLSSDTANGIARFESNAGGTALTGEMRFADNGIVSIDCSPHGCFQTAAAQNLSLEATTASFDGHLTYVECD